MVWLGPVESEDRLDWGALEPRVLIERQEQLSLVEQQPEAVPGDVGYFSLRSGCSTDFGSPARARVSTAPNGADGCRSDHGHAPTRCWALTRTWPRRQSIEHGCAGVSPRVKRRRIGTVLRERPLDSRFH